MAIFTVQLADGREIDVEANDQQTAARAAHAYQVANPIARPQQPTLERRANPGVLPWQQARQQQQRAARTAPYTDERWQREGLPRQLVPFARDLERFNRADPAGIVTNQRRRDSAGQGLQSFGNDVAGFFNQSPDQAMKQVGQGVSTGLSRVPGAVMDMVTHPVQTVRSMTYGPMVDAGAANIDQMQAESVGDEEAANAAAARANNATIDSGINVGGLFLGGGLATKASRGGLAAFGRQVATGVGTGAGVGGALGALRTPGNLEDRVAGATEGAGVGATIGAAAPAIVNGARGAAWAGNNAPRLVGAPTVTRMASNVWNAIPTPQNARSSVGMGARPMRRAPPRRDEAIPQEARLAQMFERARVSGDELEARAARAREMPQGETAVDLAGDTGIRTIRPVAQGPGETGALAQDIRQQRFDAGPRIVAGGAREGLRVNETPAQARARIDREYARVSAEQYNPLLEQQLGPQQRAGLAAVRERYRGDPVMRRAESRAEAIFDRDRRNGRVTGRISDNLPRFMHYLKMGLDVESKFQATPQGGGASGVQLNGIREMRTQVVRALDDNIPGYREARNEWGGLAAAEDAVGTGAEWLRMHPDDVRASRAEMTAFELEHARIGLAEEIRHASRGNDSGTKNAASGILNDPDALASIVEAFDTPEQGAQYVERVIRNQRRLMSNASQWGGGSQTYSNAAFGIDGAVHVMRNPVEGAMMAVAKWLNEAGLERANDQFGRAALQRVDTAESRAFVRRIADVLRRRARERQAAETASAAAAATATTPQDRTR